MSDKKTQPEKTEELSTDELDSVDGGIAIIGYSADRTLSKDQVANTANRTIGQDQVKFDESVNVDPLSINIQRG